jgi:hypothetical protein
LYFLSLVFELAAVQWFCPLKQMRDGILCGSANHLFALIHLECWALSLLGSFHAKKLIGSALFD